MCNKVFSLNFDMTNPNPSTFLGNVQWKLAKQMENSNYIVFSIIELSLSICLKFYKCFQESV